MIDFQFDRRELLRRVGMGFGSLALAQLMNSTGDLASRAAAAGSLNPLEPKLPPLPGKAKRVIHLFMNGGPSHVDTFDPKPKLQEFAGKDLPIPNPRTERKTGNAYPWPFKFQKYGQCGLEVSEIFTNVA